MGSDVRVYDKAITMDSLDLVLSTTDKDTNSCGCNDSNENNKGNEMAEEKNEKTFDDLLELARKDVKDFEGGKEEFEKAVKDLCTELFAEKKDANDEDVEKEF